MHLDTSSETDILIIGGGIAGCIAAISLVENYQVTLIDKLPEPIDRIGESLAPVARRILKQLNLLEGLENDSLKPIYIKNLGMQSYWGNDQIHIVDHLRNPDGMGLNLNRKAFETYLRDAAIKRGVNCIWPAKLHHSEYQNSSWHITAKSDNNTYKINSKFVIDASGRQSHFARILGIKRQHYDKLISCWISLSNLQENKMSTISASKNGWWYSAVTPNDKRVIAFQTDSDLIERSTFKNLDSFLLLAQENNEIAKILEKNNSKIKFHGTVSANSTRLEQVAGKQWAALGDAIISFDPLSSQGMFNAMASALQLKDLINKFELIPNIDSQKMEKFQVAYTHQIDEIWKHYLKHKNFFYGAEMRWKEHPFWQRRQRHK